MMSSLFVSTFFSNAVIIDANIGSNIFCYESNNLIFVLVNAETNGSITKDVKESIAEDLKRFKRDIVYVSMFESKETFTKVAEIAWGTYAWFESDPAHYIHFDDKPSQLIAPRALEVG